MDNSVVEKEVNGEGRGELPLRAKGSRDRVLLDRGAGPFAYWAGGH